MQKIALSTVEYTKDEDQIITHLFGRDEDKVATHVRVYGLKPFFYVKSNEPVPKNPRIVKIEKNNWTTIKKEPVKKIIMNLPEDIGGNRVDKEGFRTKFKTTYEDDVEFTTRAAIELGIKSGFTVDKDDNEYGVDPVTPIEFKQDLRRIHLDIETSIKETRGRMPNYNKPVNKIYCISALDSYEQEFVVFVHHKLFAKENKKVKHTTFENPIFSSLKNVISLSKHKIKKFNLKLKQLGVSAVDKNIPYDELSISQKRFLSISFKIKHLESKIEEYTNTYKLVKTLLKDNYKVTITVYNNEIDMLKGFINYVNVKSQDILTGWNAREFDVPYIIARSRLLKVDIRSLSPLRSVYIDNDGFSHIKGRIVFDTWRGFVKTLIHKRESNKLGDVGNDFFGVGKIKHDGFDKTYENQIWKFIKYNIQDVLLEYAIGVTQNVFQFFYDVKCFTGCSFSDVLNFSRVIDTFMLFKAKERKVALPSKRDVEATMFEGALVLQAPKKGIQRNVGVLDLKSLYPMCMLTLNMGEDTIRLNPKKEDIPNLIKTPLKGVYFDKKEESFLASLLKDLIEYRDSLKVEVEKLREEGKVNEADVLDRIQVVVKFITNTIYGVMGFSSFRLYNRKIALCVTTTGQTVIKYTIKLMIKIFEYIIYYGDTDSIFPLLKSPDIESMIIEMKELTGKLNKSYDKLKKVFNIDKHWFKIKPEEIFSTLLMVMKKGGDKVAKKRYAGIISWEGKIKEELSITGFDRSDMSRLGNKIMKNTLELACMGRSTKEITNYIKEEVDNIKNHPLEEIGFSKGISKPLQTYKNQDWIRGARWTNMHSSMWGKQTEFGAGSKPKYVYVKENRLPKGYEPIEIIALDNDLSLPEEIINVLDWNVIVEKTIKYKVETILDALGVAWDSIFSSNKVKGLMKYGKTNAT